MGACRISTSAHHIRREQVNDIRANESFRALLCCRRRPRPQHGAHGARASWWQPCGGGGPRAYLRSSLVLASCLLRLAMTDGPDWS